MGSAASVEALRAFGASFKTALLESMVINRGDCRRLENFLGVKIRLGKTSGTITYHQREYHKYKQRVMDSDRNINPIWEMYASAEDKRRSREDHLLAIDRLKKTAMPLGLLNDSKAISTAPPNPQALTALLNIIHSINPKICEFTSVSGNPWRNGPASHSRKANGKFIRIQTGKTY